MNVSEKASFKNGVQYAWDATSLDLAQTCARKYYYSMVRGIRPKELSVHLLFGSLIATAHEHFYKFRATGQSIDDALREVVREALVSSWDFEAGHAMIFDSPNKTRVTLIRTIVWYVEQFAVETEDGLQTYHLKDGKPAVELSFALEFSDDIVYCGHLDRVVTMGDHLYVMDQKTTGGTIGSYYFNQFSPNNQMSGYAFAGQAVLHSPIRGVIIDAAQITINYTRFERGIITRSKDQLEEWHNGVVYFLNQFQELSARAGEDVEKWPQNPMSCMNYYSAVSEELSGRLSGCPFRLLCQKSPKVREQYIKSDYVAHNWDPIKRR